MAQGWLLTERELWDLEIDDGPGHVDKRVAECRKTPRRLGYGAHNHAARRKRGPMRDRTASFVLPCASCDDPGPERCRKETCERLEAWFIDELGRDEHDGGLNAENYGDPRDLERAAYNNGGSGIVRTF